MFFKIFLAFQQYDTGKVICAYKKESSHILLNYSLMNE